MLETVLLKLDAKLAPGWVLIQVNFDPIQEIGPKVRGWALFCEWTPFCETAVYLNLQKFINDPNRYEFDVISGGTRMHSV